ncbi:MAG TPA: DUF3352 domain-containing protein [Flavobacteriaceae bacterium]|nr:DUF3352 domain-containing protein [Flavobacteriaceae bacterium]
MKNYGLLLCIILLYSCTETSKQADSTTYIPEKASLTLKSNNLNGIQRNLKNNDFISKIASTSLANTLSRKLIPLENIHTENEVVLSLVIETKDSLEFSLATPYNDSILSFKNSKNITRETLTYADKKIDKIQLENQVFFTAIKDSIFIVSSSEDILKNLLDKKPETNEVNTLLKTSDEQASFSLLINSKNQPFPHVKLMDSVALATFTHLSMLDVEVSQDRLLLNGITKAADSTKSLINVFKNTLPQQNKLPNITPENADGFLSLTFNQYKVFSDNLTKFRKANAIETDSVRTNTTLFDTATEIGIIYAGENQAFVLNSLDATTASEFLSGKQTETETYRDVPVYTFDDASLFIDLFYPFVTSSNFSTYAILDDFIVFSTSVAFLQNCIAAYQNNTTYANGYAYQDIAAQLSNTSSLLYVINNEKLNQLIDTEKPLALNSYKSTAFQCTYDTNFAHLSVALKKSKAKFNTYAVTEDFNIKLDADLLNTPHFVTNHLNREQDIVVQDIENNLYLISNEGEIFWKKKLDGAIIGNVSQVDMYKNGRLQLAFATTNKVYVLDRNGKEVAPFPLTFKETITQPLAVFDYDNNRNYRLMITQGSKVLLYNLKGKIVPGFNFASAGTEITTQPQHFKIGTKDYIVLKTKEKLFILDRRGYTRVQPKKQFNYTSQPVYIHNNKFTTTSLEGDLIAVDSQGNVTTQKHNLNEQHRMVATAKTLVTLTDNLLRIKDKTVELDFGIYTAPEIFYINDKIYVTVTDLQTHKVYLFDSQAKPIPNFPVYGNSKIDMLNADKDKALEFVTKSTNNEVLLYEIN